MYHKVYLSMFDVTYPKVGSYEILKQVMKRIHSQSPAFPGVVYLALVCILLAKQKQERRSYMVK